MSATKLHRYLRDLRLDRGELLYHMARKLGLSSATLSGYETGRVPYPSNFPHDIVRVYNLNETECIMLSRALSDMWVAKEEAE